MSNKISAITRKELFNLFINGLDIDRGFPMDSQHVTYFYYGDLTEIDFLKRLYDLNDMESLDPRYNNAESDIWQHTQNNDDYDFGWVFSDERFHLKNENDEELLRFLCEVFHPEVRNEKGSWKDFLKEVNRLLANDDFELYSTHQISNHDVYGWRIKSLAESIYQPFSQRFKDLIDSKQLIFTIKKDCREQIIQAVKIFDETLNITNDNGYNFNSFISAEAFDELSKYYKPKCYNENNEYVKADNLYDFISNTRPYCVFDAIESFSLIIHEPDFSKRINEILTLYKLPYSLVNGVVQGNQRVYISDEQIGDAPEVGVKELLQKAQTCYSNGNKQDALEKLWDAFERVKTIHTDCNKKDSVSKIINLISNGNSDYYYLIDKEFKELTEIGNKFRIRHHETYKIEINDDRYYDYFYNRCLSSISLILNFIK